MRHRSGTHGEVLLPSKSCQSTARIDCLLLVQRSRGISRAISRLKSGNRWLASPEEPEQTRVARERKHKTLGSRTQQQWPPIFLSFAALIFHQTTFAGETRGERHARRQTESRQQRCLWIPDTKVVSGSRSQKKSPRIRRPDP